MATEIHVVSPEGGDWYAGYADGKLFMAGPEAPTRKQSEDAAGGDYGVTMVRLAAGTPFSSVTQDESGIPESTVVSRVPFG